VTSRPTAYDEAYIIRLERRLMEYRRSVEEAQKRVEAASGPVSEPVKSTINVVKPVEAKVAAPMPSVENVNAGLKEGVEGAGLGNAQVEEAGGKSFTEAVIERAASILMDAERMMLRNTPLEVVEAFLKDAEGLGWKKSAARGSWSMPEEYMRYRLLENAERGARLRATPIGRALINAAQSLRGAGR